jgi:hypothetical protein
VTQQDDGRSSFVRGMTIGAIIGAIVAGSSLWSRRRRGRRMEPEPVTGEPLVEPPDVVEREAEPDRDD